MVKIFIATLLLALVSQGYNQCYLSDIHVTQSATGHKVNGKPEWTQPWCSKHQSMSGQQIMLDKK
ncbi:hypothetical protein DEO72_LG8g1663 [Vigna unguiculata]|uniref:Secreted protein n=1 Tax=Vigna unguiculata TaxID=3917 RepID=A0A4D6MRG1_VIGUN|nr:hypothetical protein DEO72_LG8g1663 [Vigna unguiculata]